MRSARAQAIKEAEMEKAEYEENLNKIVNQYSDKVTRLENQVFDLTSKISDQQNLMREQSEVVKDLATQVNEISAQLVDLAYERRSPTEEDLAQLREEIKARKNHKL